MTSTASEPEALKVGLIGYGVAGSVFHAPLIATTQGLELAAVVTANPERKAQAERDHPGVRVVTDAEALFALKPDLVVVASPNRTHVPLAVAALRSGAAVVVDKPLAATAAGGEELAELAEQLGRPFSVFQNRRWDGDFRTVAELVHSGRLGRVDRFESRFERWRPKLKGGWRELGVPAEAGGLLYDLGSHLVDQALTLFGPAAQVYAERDVRRAGALADDDTFVALTHMDGTRSHLWMSATAAALGPRFRVLGTEGAYVTYGLDGQEDALRAGHTPADSDWGVTPPDKYGHLTIDTETVHHRTLPGTYQHYYAAMAAAVRDGAPVPVPAREAVAALSVLEAAQRSAAEGRVVTLG